ncbi:hypothetical protein ACOMHN_000837 [Nucella lapillus]
MTRRIRVASDDKDLCELTEEEECLFTVIGLGKVHKIPALLSQARDFEVRGNHFSTSLLYAARYAKGDNATFIIKLLVHQGCDVNAQDDAGMTSLMHLITRNVSVDAMIPLMMCKHFDPNIQDKEGNNGLMYAATMGNCDIVDCLLSLPSAPKGADVSLRNREGVTALDVALEARQGDCCRVLAMKGNLSADDVNG